MSDAVVEVSPPRRSDPELRAMVEDFLFYEAELLDNWCLREWLELFSLEGRYLVPATDAPDGDATRDLYLIQDDRFLLEHRVSSLLGKTAYSESPHSRTRRLISNVRAGIADHAHLWATANFAVYRMRLGEVDCYIGQYRHALARDGDHLRFVERKAVLDLDALRPHGKVSIIL